MLQPVDGARPPGAAIGLRVGVVRWGGTDGIIGGLVSAIEAAGHSALVQPAYGPLIPGLQILLACGPFGSLAPLGQELLERAPAERPLLSLWMTEQLPDPRLPEPLQYAVGAARSWFDRQAYRRDGTGSWRVQRGRAWLVQRGHRFRYYGDLHWLRRAGLLSLLVVGSPLVADWLRGQGFDPFRSVLGVPANWGADLSLTRDIPVLWLGKAGSERRRRLLARLRQELRLRGVEMHVVDGVEHPYVFGTELTVLLNRSKIVINLLREPWDNNGMRFFLAAVNRAMIVGEPSLGHTPFVSGIHLVETPLPDMATEICRYLDDEPQRAAIAENGHRLATEEYTHARGVARVLRRAGEMMQTAGAGRLASDFPGALRW
jgi:hypothetical protein